MTNGFNVVPVRIKDQSTVAERMVVHAEPRRPIVPAAGFDCPRMETVDGLSVCRRKGDVNA